MDISLTLSCLHACLSTHTQHTHTHCNTQYKTGSVPAILPLPQMPTTRSPSPLLLLLLHTLLLLPLPTASNQHQQQQDPSTSTYPGEQFKCDVDRETRTTIMFKALEILEMNDFELVKTGIFGSHVSLNLCGCLNVGVKICPTPEVNFFAAFEIRSST